MCLGYNVFCSPTSSRPPRPPRPATRPPPGPPEYKKIPKDPKRPILKIFLEGLYDEESNLSKLRGWQHIIKAIWTEVRDYYQSAVTECLPGSIHLEQGPRFPPPSGIKINMMPFISSELFENCRLPENLKPYWGLIKYCVQQEKKIRNDSSVGQVFYLSIEESEVKAGFSQRVSGLHVDWRRGVNIESSNVSFIFILLL